MEKVTLAVTEYLNSLIRIIPDFPKKGIQFKDITPLLNNPMAISLTTDWLVQPFIEQEIDVVVGLESRGFLFGTNMAARLNAGFVPVRKPNKLPYDTIKAEYELEYGSDRLEMHVDAIRKGDKVVIHDDLIATGGSAKATAELVHQLGGEIVGYSFIIELAFLNGRDMLPSAGNVHSIIKIAD